MAWWGDLLVIAPQYPQRMDNSLLAVSRSVLETVSSQGGGFEGESIPILNPDVFDEFAGHEGIEAIAFHGNRVTMILEARIDDTMLGYVLEGTIASDPLGIRLFTRNRKADLIDPHGLSNRAFEAAVPLAEGGVLVLHEINGGHASTASALVWNGGDAEIPQRKLAFPPLEYRITGATALRDGRFWALNVLWEGDWDQLGPGEPEHEFTTHGVGRSHRTSRHVERILEFRWQDRQIVRTETPPIQLRLREDNAMRNWEALAWLDDTRLILATDKHPQTMLAWVEIPELPSKTAQPK